MEIMKGDGFMYLDIEGAVIIVAIIIELILFVRESIELFISTYYDNDNRNDGF